MAAHLIERFQRLAQYALHRADRARIFGRQLRRPNDVPEAGKQSRIRRAFEAQLPLQLAQQRVIAARERPVQDNPTPGVTLAAEIHRDLHPPTGHPGLDQVADPVFMGLQAARQFDHHLAVPVVHRTDFHGNWRALMPTLGATVSRHAPDHAGPFLPRDRDRTAGTRGTWGRAPDRYAVREAATGASPSSNCASATGAATRIRSSPDRPCPPGPAAG